MPNWNAKNTQKWTSFEHCWSARVFLRGYYYLLYGYHIIAHFISFQSTCTLDYGHYIVKLPVRACVRACALMCVCTHSFVFGILRIDFILIDGRRKIANAKCTAAAAAATVAVKNCLSVIKLPTIIIIDTPCVCVFAIVDSIDEWLSNNIE